MCAGPAWGQAGGGPVAPSVTPPDVRLGSLRTLVQAFQPNQLPRDTGPAWLITPSISVGVGATDNVQLVERPRRADVFTVISPAITISGDTARLRVNATYAPQASVYASTSSQTRLDHFGSASVLATVVPELFFLDVRGAVTQQSRNGGFGNSGGFGNNGTQNLNRNDQVQSISLSATPYLERRFGGWGTGRIGYSIAQTFQDSRDAGRFNTTAGQTQFNALNQFATGNLTTQRERASFVTGENLGRFNNVSVLEAVQYDGFGPYRGAYRNLVSTDFGYALTRTITLLAGTGYQDIRFNGPSPVRISEPIWNVGVRVLPNVDSSVTVGYGRRDGANSLYLDGAYSPTARTRVFARYSTGITTDSEEQQNLLQAADVNSAGLLQDRTTGAPVSSSSGSFGTQNGLFRVRRFSLTGTLLLNRDTFSATITNEDRTNLSATVFDPTFSGLQSNAVVLPAGSTSSGTFGTVSWQHELSDRLSSNASLQYGTTEFTGTQTAGGQSSTQTTLSGTAGLSYVFTETLSGTAQYRYTRRSGGPGQAVFNSFGNGSVIENSVLVSLRKSF